MEYNYKKSQILIEKVNIPEINKQIKELKKEFKRYTSNRVGELYRILSKIVNLKKLVDSRYSPRSLEWENDLNLTAVEIRYIFSYQYFSNKSKELVKDGKIEDKTICFLMWRFKFLRNEFYQNKIVKLYLNGKFKLSELGWLNQKEILRLIKGEKVLSNQDRYLISTNKSIVSLMSRLKLRGINKINSKHKDRLIKVLDNFKRYLENDNPK